MAFETGSTAKDEMRARALRQCGREVEQQGNYLGNPSLRLPGHFERGVYTNHEQALVCQRILFATQESLYALLIPWAQSDTGKNSISYRISWKLATLPCLPRCSGVA